MEISLQEFFDLQPYELDKEQKEKMLSAHLGKLTVKIKIKNILKIQIV